MGGRFEETRGATIVVCCMSWCLMPPCGLQEPRAFQNRSTSQALGLLLLTRMRDVGFVQVGAMGLRAGWQQVHV
jgi:hypothetical protein